MDLAAALAQAFAIQFFFIPVLKKNKKTRKHKFYLLMAFILGALAYAYIAFMGSYGTFHLTKASFIEIITKKMAKHKKQSKDISNKEHGK